MQEQQLHTLVERLLNNSLSTEDRKLLQDFCANENNREQFISVVNDLISIEDADVQYDWTPAIDAVLAADKPARVSFLRSTWFKAAAAILLTVGLATFYLAINHKTKPATITKADVPAPKNVKATITLANGQVVALTDSVQGTLASQGAIQIEKSADGAISYKGIDKQAGLYNTLTVARGSQVAHLNLSDGTVVTLNAGTTFRYPVAFNGNDRIVELTGEAYFEVAKDAKRKFMVKAGKLTTEVLGTHFNVKTYDNDAVKKVTLLEGSVQVSAGTDSLLLKPGQQAQFSNTLVKLDNADTENETAWINGKFRFTYTDIEEVMKQFERWYDIEVEYEAKPSKTFSGGLPRSLSARDALKVLEATGGVHFKIENKKIIVTK